MKAKRILAFLLLLSVFVLMFCFSASAAPASGGKLFFRSQVRYLDLPWQYTSTILPEYFVFSDPSFKSASYSLKASKYSNNRGRIYNILRVDSFDDTFLLEKGDKGVVRLSGVNSFARFSLSDSKYSDVSLKPSYYRLRYKYADGSYSGYLSPDFGVSWKDDLLSIDIPLECEKDVLEVEFCIIYDIPKSILDQYPDSSLTIYSGFDPSTLQISASFDPGFLSFVSDDLLAPSVDYVKHVFSILIPIGIGILSCFVGISLIPKVIFLFL